jgi:hypothetical protein
LLTPSIHGWFIAQDSAASYSGRPTACRKTSRHSGQAPWTLPTETLLVPCPCSGPPVPKTGVPLPPKVIAPITLVPGIQR